MNMFAVCGVSIACLFLVGFGIFQLLQNVEAETLLTVNIVGKGMVRGAIGTTLWTAEPYMQFLGIPYAESPKGELRFKAPMPRKPWLNEINATVYGQRCPVITTLAEMTPEERDERDLEDCLNLSIYTKSITAKQAVMFYIYGGGFYNGSACDHPPRYLLDQHQDIVLVVPQYRIGALGWLTTITNDLPGNVPLADLLLALKWVQEHIQQFGGDPQRVTIAGQSAGAAIVGALLLSPRTANENLFRSVIMQSGSIFSSWAINTKPKDQAQRICNALNCTNCFLDDGMQQCLQQVDVWSLLQVTTTDQEAFAPIVGDLLQLLPKSPEKLLAEFNRSIPVLTGFTKHDGSFVVASYYDEVKYKLGSNFSVITVRQFAEGLIDLLKDSTGLTTNIMLRILFDQTPNLLDSHDHKSGIPAYFDIANIAFMKSPIITFARKLMGKLLGNIYLYSFDYNGANTRFGYEFGNEHYPFQGGVHHSNDNIYVFNTHELNAADTQIAKKVVALWTSFIRDGVPKGLPDDPLIKAVSNDVGPYFHISSNITISHDVLQELTATIDDPNNHNLIREDVEF